MLLPATDLPEELGMEFLEGLWLLDELLLEPLDSRRFVYDEDGELQDLFDGHASFVVFGYLLGQEVHALALGETLAQPLVELRSRKRYGDATLDVEGNHAVEEQVVLALGDDL